MQMLCPECLTPLISEDGIAATCPEHAGHFRILYSRYAVSPAPEVPAPTIEEPLLPASISQTEPADESAEMSLGDLPQVEDESPAMIQPAELEPAGPIDEPAPEMDLPSALPELEIELDANDLDAVLNPEPPADEAEELEEPPAMPTLDIAPPPEPELIPAATEPEAIVHFPPEEPLIDSPGVEAPLLLDIPEPAPPVPVEPPAPVFPAIPTPPPRPVRAKKPVRQLDPQPASEADVPPLPRDAFDVPTPGISTLPESVFAPNVDLPPATRRSGTGRMAKPPVRTGRGSLPPAPPPLMPPAPMAPPPPAPAPAPVSARAPAPAPARSKALDKSRLPTPQPKAPDAGKSRDLGRCAMHQAPAVAICRTCGAGVCEKCDKVSQGNIHRCPKCFALVRQSITRTRTRAAKWSFGLACWSFLGLLLVITGATRIMFQTAGEFDGAALVLMMIWLFSPFVGLALAIFSYRRAEPNPRIVWLSIMANAVLIVAWIVPFVRILTHRQE